MNEDEEHLPTIKQELMKMVESEGPYDTKSNITGIDSTTPKKNRVSGLCFSTTLKYLCLKSEYHFEVKIIFV